jgi:transposase
MAITDEQVEPPPIEHAREADDDEEGVKPSKEEKRGRKGAHGRKPLPVDLPRERVVHEPAAAELSCASCHGAKTKIGESVSEQLEYVPASFIVLEHVRPKCACKCCQEGVAIAALPPMPIEKGRVRACSPSC